MNKMITSKNARTGTSGSFVKYLGVCFSLLMLLFVSAGAQAQGETCYTVNLGGGFWISECSWDLLNSNGEIVASGSGEAIALELCLLDDCYSLEMGDLYDDGWSGNEWTLSLNGDVVAGPFAIVGSVGSATAEFSLGSAVCPTDCPELEANFGEACDDGNPNTVFGIVQDDCSCVGIPAVANNDATSATAIACGDTIVQSLVGASASLVDECYGSGSADVWFTFTTDGSEIVTVGEGGGESFDAVVQLFQMDDLGNLVEVGPCADGSESFEVTEAGTYLFRVRPYFSSDDEANISVYLNCEAYDCPDLQANIGDACDDGNPETLADAINETCGCEGILPGPGASCASAIAVECNADPVTYSSVGSIATNTTDCSMGDNGLWFTFVGTGGDITVNSSAAFDHEVSINYGSCDALTNVECDDSSVNEESHTIEASLAGETYYVYIARYNNGSDITGDITIDIDCAEPPACDAPLLTLALQDAADTPIEDCVEIGSSYFVLATLEGGSGNDSYTVLANGSDSTNVPADGSHVFGPFTTGSDVDISAVGVDDPQCGAEGSIDSPAICPPSNDDCADAIAISCGDTLIGSTVGATQSGLDPTCGIFSSSDAQDIFYSFEADGASNYIITAYDADPSNYIDGVLSVYSGTCGSLTSLGCADSGNPETVELLAPPAGVYFIRVFDYSGTGSISISLSCIENFDCPELEANIGDSCDDENPDTENDAVTENCGCAGLPAPDFSVNCFYNSCDHFILSVCEEATVPIATLDVTALHGFNEPITLSLSGAPAGMTISSFSYTIEPPYPDAFNHIFVNLPVGLQAGSYTYDIVLTSVPSGITHSFTTTTQIMQVNLSPWYNDADGDGFGDPNAPALNCEHPAGYVADNTDDCPFLFGRIGDSCDDGNPDTEDDTVSTNCECLGTPIITFDCPNLSLNIGDSCNDENPDTENDVVTENCGCAGTIVFDCPQLQANVGDSCNDENPDTENDVVTQNCGCAGTPVIPIFDCLELEANFGDSCDDENPDTENDVVTESCDCAGTPVVAPTCEDFVYYLADNLNQYNSADIYEVVMSGGVAQLNYIITSDDEVHLAYNPIDNLLYAVSRDNHNYRTLNPHVANPSFGPAVDLGNSLTQITTAVFNHDGKLLIGSQNQNKIWTVNVTTNVVSSYDTYSPIYGGDLAFGSDGMLYLATRTGTGLYQNWPAAVSPDQLIGSVPNSVTGMAITDVDQLLLSSLGSTSLELRNSDGSNPGVSYPVMLNGAPYTLRNGDLASGCNTFSDDNEADCDYKLYYNHQPAGGGPRPLLEVTLNDDGTASYNTIIADITGHIGLTPDGSLIYLVQGSRVKIIDIALASVISNVNIVNASGQNLSGFPTAVVANDGTFYAASPGEDQVYTLDPITGIATPYGPSRDVSGADLVEIDGEIWLITRNNNRFTNVITGDFYTVAPSEINGAAVLPNGNVLVSDGDGNSLLKEIDITTHEVVATYDINLPLHNGDLAGACIGTNPSVEGCFGSEVLDFEQGPQTNGGAVNADRSDENAALGEPDRSNAPGGFFSLGVGGHITIGFAGVINDAPGNDIRIWETSYAGDVCGGSSDEQADIELSADGITFVSAGSICLDGEVDMAAAGLTYVTAIRITNSASTGTLDGYDVDGVEAINGCSNEPLVVPGDCYATDVVDHVQGVDFNGDPINPAQTDPEDALGVPEFATSGGHTYNSLGYGGSIILAFDGAVLNEAGVDIEVIEATGVGYAEQCEDYPEYADIYVSVDGVSWFFTRTVCKFDGFVDISTAGDFDYINYVKIVNNDVMTSTIDAYDVDGVRAIHNCEDSEPSSLVIESTASLTSYPNPTSGMSEVVFTTAKTGKTFVDVYDMNGRKVATIFNQVAQEGVEYRLDFDGLSLPNGFYVYVLTNNHETTIERFLIAK